MVKVYDNAPEWFARKDFLYLGKLDAAGWLHELQRCDHLAKEVAKRKACEPSYEEKWKGILDDEIAAGFFPCYIGPPAVEVVDEAGPESLGTLKEHMLILQVCLQANDADIMAAVAEELRRAREWYPSQIKKPGPQTLNGSIGKAEFERWRNHKIVEISDLLDRASREGRALSNADLGRWLFETHSDPDKAACKALEERRRAFASIPALCEQVRQSLPTTRLK